MYFHPIIFPFSPRRLARWWVNYAIWSLRVPVKKRRNLKKKKSSRKTKLPTNQLLRAGKGGRVGYRYRVSYTLSREYRVVRNQRSPLHQFGHARTIDEYDVTMLVPRIRVTSQINCGDVTMLSQERSSLVTMAK